MRVRWGAWGRGGGVGVRRGMWVRWGVRWGGEVGAGQVCRVTRLSHGFPASLLWGPQPVPVETQVANGYLRLVGSFIHSSIEDPLQ